MQGIPITAGENRFLPKYVATLPEQLKGLGYRTCLVGKWHLGASYRGVTPSERGFDEHFGYWHGYIGYFDYFASSKYRVGGATGKRQIWTLLLFIENCRI